MKIPKVFISYSHDTIEHKKWVLDLAIRMRNNGIDSIIDQWELQPGDDLPHFMETHLSDADKVVMVCTDNYVQKSNGGRGGVGYEKMILTSDLIQNINQSKIIPIIKQSSATSLPTFLKTKLYINFSNKNDEEFSFDELIRAIHNSPIYKKPPIGNNPFKEVNDSSAKKNHDEILLIMRTIVEAYDNTDSNFIYYTHLRRDFPGSRIILDILLDKTRDLGYINRDTENDIVLLEKGKLYAINNNLI